MLCVVSFFLPSVVCRFSAHVALLVDPCCRQPRNSVRCGPLQGASILEGKFDPAFPLKHAQKDMRFAVVSNVLVDLCRHIVPLWMRATIGVLLFLSRLLSRGAPYPPQMSFRLVCA